MSWGKVKLGEFLKSRENRFKPNDKAIKGFKRVDKIDFSGNIYLSDKLSNTDMILIKKGDLIISGINVEKGAMAVYQGEEDITSTIHYSSYEYDKNKIDIEFLKCFLKSPEFLNALRDQVPGGIKTEIKPKHILPLVVNIPDTIEHQKLIVGKLNGKNKNIEAIRNELDFQLNFTNQLRQAFLREAMQGKLVPQDPNDEPASELLKKIKIEKSKIQNGKKEKPLPEIKPEEIPFEIPENWMWCRLGEIAELNGRIGWKGLSASEYTKEGPLFLSVYSLNYGDYVDYSQAFHISEERYEESPEIILKNDDILICKDGAGIGKLGIVKNLKKNATINSSLLLIRTYHFLITKFFYYYLLSNHFQKIVNMKIMGATTPHLYQRDLVNFYIPIPPLPEQKRIVSKLEELMKYCDELENLIKESKTNTNKLMQVVLQEALNG